MKSFLKIIILSFSIVFVGIFVIEYLYKDYRSNIDLMFDQYYEQEGTEVILIGNSHVGSLGSPSFNAKKSFNFSVGGQDIFHCYAILKTILKQENKISQIILGVDYDVLGYDYKIANTMWLDRNYYATTNCLYDSSFANEIMAGSSFFQSNRNIDYLLSQNNVKHDSSKKEDHSRFTPVKGNPVDRALEHSFHKFDTALVRSNSFYLEKVVSLARKKAIPIVLVNLPKHSEYYKNYNQVAIEVGRKALGTLCTKHQINFLDLWKSEVFNDADFLDGDHLSESGAQKALSLIDEQLNKIESQNNLLEQ